jgi:hypothetical protein
MPSTFDFRLGWLAWAIVGLAWEILALRHGGGGDELTSQIRWIVSHPFAWWAGAGLAIWTAGHLFLGWR